MAIQSLTMSGTSAWAALVAILQAQMNVGTIAGIPTLRAGTNPTGKLQGVKAVGKSSFPDFAALPFVGVQLERSRQDVYSAPRGFKVHHDFTISVVVEVEAAGDAIISLDDGMAALQAILDDGAGNGVYPILMTRANFSLGGITYESMVTEISYSWDRSPAGKGQNYVAFAAIKYEASTVTRGD